MQFATLCPTTPIPCVLLRIGLRWSEEIRRTVDGVDGHAAQGGQSHDRRSRRYDCIRQPIIHQAVEGNTKSPKDKDSKLATSVEKRSISRCPENPRR